MAMMIHLHTQSVISAEALTRVRSICDRAWEVSLLMLCAASASNMLVCRARGLVLSLWHGALRRACTLTPLNALTAAIVALK